MIYVAPRRVPKGCSGKKEIIKKRELVSFSQKVITDFRGERKWTKPVEGKRTFCAGPTRGVGIKLRKKENEVGSWVSRLLWVMSNRSENGGRGVPAKEEGKREGGRHR